MYKHELEFSGNLQFENIHILHLVQTNTVVLFKIKNVLHIVGTAQWLDKWQNKIKQCFLHKHQTFCPKLKKKLNERISFFDEQQVK